MRWYFELVVMVSICTILGCNNKPGPQSRANVDILPTNQSHETKVIPTAPAIPKVAPTKPKSEPLPPSKQNPTDGKITTLDLTQYGLRAVIEIPEGADIQYQMPGQFRIGYGKFDQNTKRMQYAIAVDLNSYTFEDSARNAKDTFDKPILHADKSDMYFYEEDANSLIKHYAMGRSVMIGGYQYLVSFRCVDTATQRETVLPLWKAIQSIRQTTEQQRIEAARSAALKKFYRKGDDPEFVKTYWHNNDDNELVVNLTYEVISPDSVRLLKDIPDLHTVRLEGFNQFDKELFQQILKMPGVRGLSLNGPWVTDEVLTLVSEAPQLTSVILREAAATDKGFALLEKLPKLQKVEIEFCEMITNRAIESLRKKFPDLKFSKFSTFQMSW